MTDAFQISRFAASHDERREWAVQSFIGRSRRIIFARSIFRSCAGGTLVKTSAGWPPAINARRIFRTSRANTWPRNRGMPGEHELILSKLMAERLFPAEDPVGQSIQMGSHGAWSTVVGVADNVKNGGLTEQDAPEVYALRGDVPEDWEGQVALSGSTGGSGPVMVVRTDLSLSSTAAWIHSQVTHLDPAVPIEIEPVTEYVHKLADRPRFATALLSFFAFTGLTMAVIGLYGVISFLALQRTQEIGVRMALGADRIDILKLIAREGMRAYLDWLHRGIGGRAGYLENFQKLSLRCGTL